MVARVDVRLEVNAMWRSAFFAALFIWIIGHLSDRGKTMLWAAIVLILACYAGFVWMAFEHVR